MWKSILLRIEPSMLEAVDAAARKAGLKRSATIRLLLAQALGTLYIKGTTELPSPAGAVEPEPPPLAVPAPAPSSPECICVFTADSEVNPMTLPRCPKHEPVVERPHSEKSPIADVVKDDIDELLAELDI